MTSRDWKQGGRCAAAVLAWIAACAAAHADGTPADVSVEVRRFLPRSGCEAAFRAHDLDHRTLPSGLPIELFDSHGAGVAAGDLDGDGDLDLVLTNLAGPVSLLWNEGGLRFRRQIVPIRHTRAVTVVDADGDDLLDIAFTRGNGPPELWRRDTLDGEFDRLFHPAPAETAYTMAWGDLDGDGDLDLVTATYDAELVKNLGFGHGAGGVFYHERVASGLRTTRLADRAEALALLLVDLDGDGRPDIHVGNDFALIDQVWLRTGTGWTEAMPFRAISRNTMSLDAGDVDADGEEELFAADMSPYSAELARHYLTVMMKMAEVPGERTDQQVIANVLLSREEDGRYRNSARTAGVASSGWSWSAKLGDLDHDGALDLYVVNGMAGSEQFPYLPDGELIEQNQAYRNIGEGRFTPAPEWELASERSGRGMGMVDLDLDGDLDIVVNNLATPAQLFENRMCGGSAVQVELRQSGANTRAIGAVVRLRTAAGVQRRDVRSASGYLFGDPQRVHFGLPSDAVLQTLEVRWPDGAVSTIDDPPAGALLTIRRKPS
ncbi:MAG: FG-GAP-like repeat-containing protein [Spirochaetaceae bacterium]|nr:FG-GAP-like repeat-containing protein [Spirochaetaceae bacterium]